MAERFSGNVPYPKKGTFGSNRRGLVAHAASRSGVEGRLSQSQIDKQKQIDKFKQRRDEQLLLDPNRIDLGNKSLDAYKMKLPFQKNLLENKVMIWTGETGTGKSTQGVQFVIELIKAPDSKIKHIYVVVPRKIIADNLGDRIRDELKEHYGEAADGMVNIIHSERSERSEESVATVLTAQTLIRMEKSMREKHVDEDIIIFNDEVHEKDLHTEMAIATSAIYVNDNPGSRIVLASATMDEAFVQETYKELNDGNTVPIVTIPGRPHALQFFERPDLTPMEAYLEYGNDVEKMMAFTRGEKPLEHFIKETGALLDEREKNSSRHVEFRKLIGTLTPSARARVFTDEFPKDSRLLIASSPAGMSGITNPGNQGVITDGTINRKELDQYGVEGIRPDEATQAELKQMGGRAGRDVDGGFAVLVKPITPGDDLMRARGIDVENPEMEFVSFTDRAEYPPAQIYHSNLSRVALEAAGLGKRLTDLNPYFQNKVELTDILKAEKSLAHLGALNDDQTITDLGRAMDVFPLSPELARGLVEATQPGRTLLHMGRAVLTAAAIDSGGLQDFTKKDTSAWDTLIRSTSKDDFIAQLDIMTALREEANLEGAAEKYDLQPNKVEQATKMANKIFKLLKIRPEDVIFGTTKPEEEELLRDDFTAGMIDLVYEKSGRQRKTMQYTHILGNEGSTQRAISDRSVAGFEDHDYIAGFPRWYITRDRNGEHVNQIIDRTLIVKPDVIARYAAKVPNMLKADTLEPRFSGGRVIEQEQLSFGSIIVGEPIQSTHDVIPEDSRLLLKQKVLVESGIAQDALRGIAKELAWYEESIPKEELSSLLNEDAPAYITHESIEALIYEKTALTRDAYAIDDLLSSHIYSKNIAIQQYYTQEVLDMLRTRSPKVVTIGKQIVDVFYENGQPYITKVSATQRQAPLSDFYLPDGREILIQISRSQRLGGVTRVSPKDLIADS